MTDSNANEVRCQEKPKPRFFKLHPVANLPRPPPPICRALSAEAIKEKWEAAKRRRMIFQAKCLAALSEKLAKIEESRMELGRREKQLIQQTEELCKDNNPEHIQYLKTRLTERLDKVGETREFLEQQKLLILSHIDEKLKMARNPRRELILKIMDEIVEKRVKTLSEERVRNERVGLQIKTKLTSADERKPVVPQNEERLSGQNQDLETASTD